MVKIAGFILTIILAFLTVQPAIASLNLEDKTECCMKEKSCTNDKNTCEQKACNPLRLCAFGNFFVLTNYSTNLTFPSIATANIAVVNDNRTSSSLSECFHPPRI